MGFESKVLAAQVRRLLSLANKFSGKLNALPEEGCEILCADFDQIRSGITRLGEQVTAGTKPSETRPTLPPYRPETAEQAESIVLDLRGLAHQARMATFRLEAIVNNVMAAIVFYDKDGLVQLANAAVVALLGFDPTGMDHRKLFAAVSIKDESGQPVLFEQMPAIRAFQGEMVSNQVFTFNIPRRGVHYLSISSMPLYTGSEFTGVVSVWNDITEQRNQEEARIEALTRLEVQRRLLEYREKERQEIGRDVHDGPIQSLASVMFQLQFIKEELHDEQVRAELERVGNSLKSTVRELRDMVNALRPPSLIRFGVTKAFRVFAEDFHDRNPHIQLHLELLDEQIMPPEEICLALYRIYQEGLNNVARHSQASQAWIRYSSNGSETVLEISDNGKGIPGKPDLVRLAQQGHFGLAGMKERAEAIGGTLQVSSRTKHGTTVRVRVPMPEKIKNKM